MGIANGKEISTKQLCDIMEEAYRRGKEVLPQGKVATYIPELGKADPGALGISLCARDRWHCNIGDTNRRFTIQSISNVISLALALELRLPVIFHDRDAHGDSLAIVKEFPDVTGVFHCFSGSPEMAQELLGMGWYLGFDGPVTYKNARRAPEVAAVTPLERMLIETDSPYMTPVPYRGQRNDSSYVRLVAEKLAEWKDIAPEELEHATLENGKRLFRIIEQ